MYGACQAESSAMHWKIIRRVGICIKHVPEALCHRAHIKDEQLDLDAIHRLRQEHEVPLIEQLTEWMIAEYSKVLPKSPIGRAIAYSLQRWEKLSLHATNSVLKIDNNPIENAIRSIAIGRKNYLFAGRHEAAQRAAMVYSMFATCRLHNISPFDWLKDLSERMHLYSTNNIAELLPQNWQES